MDDCLFCKIVSGEIPCEKIYENEHVLAFLDIKPLNDGHALVVPKEHHADITVIPKDVFVYVMEAARIIAPAIKNAVKAGGININMNNGAAAGQVIFHLHAHIIPRKTDDGYRSWSRTTGDLLPLGQTREKIISALKR